MVNTKDASGWRLSLDPQSPRLEVPEDGTLITRSILPGGLRVITQEVPTSRSVVLGFWVPAGSRDEGPDFLGSTHYLEHLLFKGSKQRNAIEIAKAFDAVGGDFNAATGKESTHYYCRVLVRDLPMALRVMADMVIAPKLAPEDFQMEQAVIIDELAMAQDDPSDVAFENFCAQLFGEHPLGKPVGGTPQTVKATPLSAVRTHHQRWYQPQHVVVSAAGGITHDQICDLLLEAVADSSWKLVPGQAPCLPQRTPAEILPSNEKWITKKVEQAQVIVGCRSLDAQDPRRDAMSMLMTLLSGGMSSRLFQEIREKRGLAYSTYAFDSTFTDTGHFGMYAGCAPKNVAEVSKLMVQQLEQIAQGQITAEERELALGQFSGGVALGLESNRARMSRLGRVEVCSQILRTVEQVFAGLSAVTIAEVSQLAQELLSQPWTKVVVSPEKE